MSSKTKKGLIFLLYRPGLSFLVCNLQFLSSSHLESSAKVEREGNASDHGNFLAHDGLKERLLVSLPF